MVTLFASLIGFFGSIVPDIFKMINDKRDKMHELEVMDRQIKMYEQGVATRLEEIQTSADVAEAKILHQSYKSGIFFVDLFNSSVRPVLAYSFFVLYAVVKYMQFIFISNVSELKLLFDVLWSVEDQAIFSGIIGFYFGQRLMSRRLNQGR